MEYTLNADVTAVKDPAAGRACAYGLDAILEDGQDADIVYRTAKAAFDKARAGGGPSLLEFKTYRYSGHSRADPAKYRPAGELEDWKQNRDAIKIYRQRLLDTGTPEAKIVEIEDEIRLVVEQATVKCKAAPPPSADLLMTDVYADGGSAWRN
jgi:pyruvate dehydrogenase E1 component alpha subunit